MALTVYTEKKTVNWRQSLHSVLFSSFGYHKNIMFDNARESPIDNFKFYRNTWPSNGLINEKI